MNNLYFEINPIKKHILKPPKELETSWRNISGLVYLEEDKLYDLSWAGHEGIGFLKICKENAKQLQNFKSVFNALDSLKVVARRELSKNRYEKEVGIIILNDFYKIQLTEEYKLSLVMKYLECLESDFEFDWKTISGYFKFNSNNFKIFYKKIQEYTQKLFDIEKNILEQINAAGTIEELLNINLEINYDNSIRL